MRPESRQIVFKKPYCSYSRTCANGLFPMPNKPENQTINTLGDYCIDLKCSYLKWVITETMPCEDSFLQKVQALIQGEKNNGPQ